VTSRKYETEPNLAARIEQHRAAGWTVERTAAVEGVTEAEVERVWADQDALNAEDHDYLASASNGCPDCGKRCQNLGALLSHRVRTHGYVNRGASQARHPSRVLDEVAIAEAMSGRRVKLTFAERRAVVERLTALGLSAQDIAQRLGTTHRCVTRRRAAGTAA